MPYLSSTRNDDPSCRSGQCHLPEQGYGVAAKSTDMGIGSLGSSLRILDSAQTLTRLRSSTDYIITPITMPATALSLWRW